MAQSSRFLGARSVPEPIRLCFWAGSARSVPGPIHWASVHGVRGALLTCSRAPESTYGARDLREKCSARRDGLSDLEGHEELVHSNGRKAQDAQNLGDPCPRDSQLAG